MLLEEINRAGLNNKEFPVCTESLFLKLSKETAHTARIAITGSSPLKFDAFEHFGWIISSSSINSFLV